MQSFFSRVLALAAIASLAGCSPPPLRADELKVCADPNNLPFSNDRREGFENALAELVARELGRDLHYTWWAQRRGFIRSTLKAGLCDLVMRVPADYDPVATTAPYYRSAYVFVSRADRGLDISSHSDVRLKTLRIGVHLSATTG
jgi:mxaJ protein